MNMSPLSRSDSVGGSLIALFLMVGAWHALGQNVSEAPIVEVQGQFFRATKFQRETAFDAAGVDRSVTVLTPEQFGMIRGTLQSKGVNPFSVPRVVAQSGESSSAAVVKEFRYPTQYEPSKKEPGKSVPIAFEMMPIGVTLEAAPTVDASGRIQLKATPTFSRFLGFIEDGGSKPNGKGSLALQDLLKAPLHAGTIWQPVISTFTETRAFNLADGQTAVISGRPAPEADSPDLEVLVFLTVQKVIRD